MPPEKIQNRDVPITPLEEIINQPLKDLDLSKLKFKVAEYSEDIKKIFEQHDNMVGVFPTGTGKTVVLPPIILKHFPRSRIAITEPRNAPLKKTGEFMAKITGQEVGDLIGRRYEGSGKLWDDEKTRITILMEQRIQNAIEENDLLLDYNVVIVDEAHENGPQSEKNSK